MFLVRSREIVRSKIYDVCGYVHVSERMLSLQKLRHYHDTSDVLCIWKRKSAQTAPEIPIEMVVLVMSFVFELANWNLWLYGLNSAPRVCCEMVRALLECKLPHIWCVRAWNTSLSRRAILTTANKLWKSGNYFWGIQSQHGAARRSFFRFFISMRPSSARMVSKTSFGVFMRMFVIFSRCFVEVLLILCCAQYARANVLDKQPQSKGRNPLHQQCKLIHRTAKDEEQEMKDVCFCNINAKKPKSTGCGWKSFNT